MATPLEIERLEDLFEALGVKFDERVLASHRMRILRRFGQELKELDELYPAPNEAEVQRLYATALATIYDQCSRGMREAEPVFRGVASQLVQLRRRPCAKE